MRGQLIQLAKRDAPIEAVGLLGGKSGKVTELTAFSPCNNHSPTPTVALYVEPDVMQRTMDALTKLDHDPVGYYHSHNDCNAVPSLADLAMCPKGWLMVIVAPHLDEVRTWTSSGHELDMEEVG